MGSCPIGCLSPGPASPRHRPTLNAGGLTRERRPRRTGAGLVRTRRRLPRKRRERPTVRKAVCSASPPYSCASGRPVSEGPPPPTCAPRPTLAGSVHSSPAELSTTLPRGLFGAPWGWCEGLKEDLRTGLISKTQRVPCSDVTGQGEEAGNRAATVFVSVCLSVK